MKIVGRHDTRFQHSDFRFLDADRKFSTLY